MAAFILDASAVVKRYLLDAGTSWVRSLADPAAAHEIFLTRITRVEATAAVARSSRGGIVSVAIATALLTQFRYDATHQYNITEITPPLLTEAERLAEVYGLRAYDAVQLAASLELHQRRQAGGLGPITLISADQELNAAATAEGLSVDDTRAHP
jgi:predicted nucleic acid-binding protein